MTTILIAEDEFAVLAILARTLQAAGFHVVRASHGREALRLLQAERCDVILCDEMMPLMDGRTLAREARALSAYAATPILLMSEASDGPLPEGVTALLPKPIRLHVVLQTLARYAKP